MKTQIKPKKLKAKVEALFYNYLDGTPIKIDKKAKIMWGGLYGDRFFGRTTLASTKDVREVGVSKGSEILNIRQLTIVSKEELTKTAKNLGIKDIDPKDMKANIVLSGIKNLTLLPIGTKLIFPKQCVLFVTGENYPCYITGNRVQASNAECEGVDIRYAKEAMHKRGLIAITLRPGWIYLNDEVDILIPPQRIYE